MWFRICLCFLLAFVNLDSGYCDEFEWLTTLLPEDSDSLSAEEADSSLEHEDSTYSTMSESPGPRSGSRSLNGQETPDVAATTEQTLSTTTEKDVLELYYVPQDGTLYPYFRIAIKEIAASEEGIRTLFDVVNSPPPRRMLLDCIFFKRIRDYFDNKRKMEAEGNVDKRAFQTSTKLATDYSSTHTSSEAAVDDTTYSSDGADQESATPDLLEVGRSGLLNAEVSPEASRIRDCEGRCRQPNQNTGHVHGIPGEHFPYYRDIPETTFSCEGKLVPGFYADLDTGCQVFHACWPHRRESYLCPYATTFNQAVLSCDDWYSSNCSLAPLFFDRHLFPLRKETSTDPLQTERTTTTRTLPKTIPTHFSTETLSKIASLSEITLDDWLRISKFVPVKSKIISYPNPGSLDPETSKTIKEWLTRHQTALDPDDKNRKLLIASQILGQLRVVFNKVALDVVNSLNKLHTYGMNRARQNSKMFGTHSSIESPSQVNFDPAPLQKNKPCIGKTSPTINPRFVVKPVELKVSTEQLSVASTSSSPPKPTEDSVNRPKVSSEGKSMMDANVPTMMPAWDLPGEGDTILSMAERFLASKVDQKPLNDGK